MNQYSYVYSDSLDEMVVKAFIYHGHRYEWHDADCVYYRDDDEVYLIDVPKGATIYNPLTSL